MTPQTPQPAKPTVPSIAPRLIKPGKPEVITVYQLAGELDTAAAGATTWNDAVRLALEWVRQKFPEPLPADADIGSGFLKEVPGQKAECVLIADEGRFALHLQQPDAPFRGRPAVGGRVWSTDVALARHGSSLLFGIRVHCASLPGCSDDIFLTRPRIVSDLATHIGLRQAVALRPEPWTINSAADVQRLHNLLLDPARDLPVVVLTQPDAAKYPNLDLGKYLLDEKDLAARLLGYAHVVCMPPAVTFDWTNRLTKQWSVFEGAVRTYMPDLNFDTDLPSAHPLALVDRVLFYWNPRTKAVGESVFRDHLVQRLQEYGTTRRIQWGDLQFVTDLRMRQLGREQARITESLSNAQNDREAVRLLRQQFEAQAAEVKALQEKLRQVQEENEAYCTAADDAERGRQHYQELNRQLRARVHFLGQRLMQATHKPVDDQIPIPRELGDLQEWAGEHLAGRLVLHPRVRQGIKEARYQDTEKVYRALLLLANEYRDMRMSVVNMEAYQQARDRLGLKDGGSITESRAGEQGDTYFVQYPVGGYTRRFLESHLRCGGNTRDPERCLAIYYFWDDEEQCVVVGWLPGHLENRMT